MNPHRKHATFLHPPFPGCSDDDGAATAATTLVDGNGRLPHGLPPRPPSTPLPPPPPVGILKRPGTPASSSVASSGVTSLTYTKSPTPSPHNTSGASSGSASSSASSSDTINKLREEIEGLKEKFVASEKHWHEVRPTVQVDTDF